MRKKALRGFSLAELIIVIVVLGILSVVAYMGFSSVVNRSSNERIKEQTRSWVRQAQALYALNSPSDPTYSWQQALEDVAQDFPPYSQVGSSDAQSPTSGTNVNGWVVETDSGPSSYSTGPNHMLIRPSGDLLFFAVAYSNNDANSSSNGMFGAAPTRGSITVWDAVCGYQSCDATSALAGPPPGGSYGTVPGATTTTVAGVTTTTVPGATTTTVAACCSILRASNAPCCLQPPKARQAAAAQ